MGNRRDFYSFLIEINLANEHVESNQLADFFLALVDDDGGVLWRDIVD